VWVGIIIVITDLELHMAVGIRTSFLSCCETALFTSPFLRLSLLQQCLRDQDVVLRRHAPGNCQSQVYQRDICRKEQKVFPLTLKAPC
jgi:hypothetical protein